MGKQDDRRKKDMKNRLAPAEEAKANERRARNEAVQALIAKELGDPARLPIHVRRLGALAFALPTLRPLRLPMEPFLQALIELRPPQVEDPIERQRAHRATLAERSGAGAEVLVAHARLFEQAMGEVEDMEDLLALAAGRAMLMALRETPTSWTHPYWALMVEITFSECWMSGLVLSHIGLLAQRTSREEVGPVLARALAQTELSAELPSLGVEELDPDALAEAYVAQVHGDRADLAPFELEFDAVLHLVAFHAGIAAHMAERVAKEGLSDEVRAELLKEYEDCYEDDVTPDLVNEMLLWSRAHLSRLRDTPEAAFGGKVDPARLKQERLRAAGLYVGLRLFAPAESKLLRAMHLRGLHRAARLAGEHERPSVQKLWSNPTDMHGLEEYEQILRDLRQPNRAVRVARFRADLRKARKEAEAEGRTT